MAPKKPRINRGKHIIISERVHSELKVRCVKAGVEVTKIADEVLATFIDALPKDVDSNDMLVTLAEKYDARNPPAPKRPVAPVDETKTDNGVDTPAQASEGTN